MKPAARRISQSLVALYSLTGLLGFAKVVQAQVTPDNTGGSGTTVNQEGNKFQIEDGVEAGDNLIHSFDQFSLGSDQSAIFNIDANIQNILSRVTGGNLSQINGLIEVLGGTGSTNLFLMNPAGIVFGQGASLDVPGSFTATTATSIGLGNDQWFNATGPIDASKLAGNPNNSFAFNTSEPGGIVSSANLTVDSGNLTLIGGTVVSEGTLSAPQGQVNIATVPGDTVVRLSQPGMVLNLEFEPVDSVSGNPGNWDGNIASLPQLLTGGGIDHATQAIADADGQQVILSGSGITVNNGDVVATGKITGQDGIGISANNITTGELDTSSNRQTAPGSISLLAIDDIKTGDIRTSDSSGGDRSAGLVQISTLQGNIDLKNLFGEDQGQGNSATFTLEAPQGEITIRGDIRILNRGPGDQGQVNWVAQNFTQDSGKITEPSNVVSRQNNPSISNPLNSISFPPFTEFNSDFDNSDNSSDGENSNTGNDDSSDGENSNTGDDDSSDSDNSNTANDDSSDGENSNTEDSSDSNSDIANQDGDGVDMGDIGNDLNNNDVTNSEDEEFTDPVDVDDIDDSILDTEDSSGNTDTSDSGDSQTADSSGNTDTSDSGDSQTADSSGNTDTSDS
ncbi:two-partner secretion domain-containing protein, partial [Coleofasciculus sp. E1-EBD-02]|uniref:two-partner secretion domain-containing protein n=1 Tax=Coleofasciculus sp. E1-EBD-02 TaxID=3068481 RepID=UPI003302EA49